MDTAITLQHIATWGTLAGTIATAIATFFLWRVTRILAVETKRMADASAQPQVVVNITPNQWALNHVNLVAENTGNATAFDVEIAFDPPLENGEVRSPDRAIPFQKISLLKPGQSLSSYLSEASAVLEKTYNVQVSWKPLPNSADRQTLSYLFSMKDYTGMTQLGAADPIIQIADQVKNIREDWRNVARGHHRLKADIYTEAERQHERDIMDERRRQAQQERTASQKPKSE